MNYLQYAFYAINIYLLEKVMEDFRWGNTRARQSGHARGNLSSNYIKIL
jgi:hypothetical protein